MRITDEICKADGAERCNTFVLLGDQLTLVEGGYPGDGLRALDTMTRLGFESNDLKRVVLTHGHPDHIGGIPEILERTDARVFAHSADADLIEQHFPLAGVLEHGDLIDILGGLRVVHAPGHRPGSICLYSPSRKVLFCGDALVNRGELTGPNPKYTPYVPQAHRSIVERIPPLDFDILCVSRGEIITERAAERVRALAAELDWRVTQPMPDNRSGGATSEGAQRRWIR